MSPAAWFALGLVLLLLGADRLVSSARRMAGLMGIPSLIVGLTVVAFATSTPELALGVMAALAGQTDLVMGNVIGSNIANVLLILGLSALLRPLGISAGLVRREIPLMVAFSLILWVMAGDGVIGRGDGAVLVALGLAYTVWVVRACGPQERARDAAGSLIRALLGLALGVLLLVLGARWMVFSAAALAAGLGLSELFIGLTLVALGTSLPELATALMASVRGSRDVSVGDLLGSNLYNIAWVLGLTSLVHDVPVNAAALRFDLPVMVGVALACLPIFLLGAPIRRWEGALLLGAYLLYLGALALGRGGAAHIGSSLG